MYWNGVLRYHHAYPVSPFGNADDISFGSLLDFLESYELVNWLLSHF